MLEIPRSARLVAGVAIISLAVAACGSSGTKKGGGAKAASGAITISGSEPQNPLVPANTNEVGGGDIIDDITTGLVNYDPKTAAPKNSMAESIDTTDNITFKIKIKKGWKFHDGTEVKAKNFVDAWNWGAYGPNAGLSAGFFEPIEGSAEVAGKDANGDEVITAAEAPVKTMSGLKVDGDYAFSVKMSAPVSNFPVRLGYSAFVPLPDSFYKDPKAYGTHPIGNGPFKFVSWTHNQSIKLTAFTGYQGPDKPVAKDVTYKIYQSQDAAYNDLLAGNLDIMEVLPPSALAGEKYKSDLGKRFVEQASGTFQDISFPPVKTDPSFKSVDLRKAISEAIDRKLIVHTIFNDTRIPATGWVSPVVDGYKAGACGDACTFNAEKAKADLQKAGGFSGTMTLSYNADGAHKEWTVAACNSISKTLGVKCVATPVVDFATFRGKITDKKLKGMFRTGWQMDYPSIEDFLAPIYRTGAGSNDSDYSSPDFDKLLEDAAAAKGDKANQLYQQAEALLAKEMPVIPLWYVKTQAGWSKNIASVQFNPFGVAALETIKKA